MTLLHLPNSPRDYIINLSFGGRVISIVGTETVNPSNTDDDFYDVALDDSVEEISDPPPVESKKIDRKILDTYDSCRCSNRSGGFTKDTDGLWKHGECMKPTRNYLDAMQFRNVIHKVELVEM